MRFSSLVENSDMIVEHGIAIWKSPEHCWYYPIIADGEGEVYISKIGIDKDDFDMRQWVSAPHSYKMTNGLKLNWIHIQLAPINWELKKGDWELVILQASPDYEFNLPYRTSSAKQLETQIAKISG